jgi:uncharacterized protein YbdZ (MbtH family)
MHDADGDPFDTYSVVVNHEEQYSIWPSERPVPAGWRTVGKQGPKQECLDYIAEVWTDMRPLSLRRKMEEWARNPPPVEAADDELSTLPTLVDRLCEGEHRVVVNCRPERTTAALNERLAIGHVHVLFTETRGGTELGVRVESSAIDWTGADPDRVTGTVRFSGTLVLDYVKVRCVAAIDLATLEGTAHLAKIEDVVEAA